MEENNTDAHSECTQQISSHLKDICGQSVETPMSYREADAWDK